MKTYFLFTLFCCINFIFAEGHKFIGEHFFARYELCDEKALKDLPALEDVMEKAVIATGATILSSTKHVFPPDGISIVILVSESHASIHTYPEYRACFVDIFTCGETCNVLEFDRLMKEYLKPQKVEEKLVAR